jgi:hypothetical protein
MLNRSLIVVFSSDGFGGHTEFAAKTRCNSLLSFRTEENPGKPCGKCLRILPEAAARGVRRLAAKGLTVARQRLDCVRFSAAFWSPCSVGWQSDPPVGSSPDATAPRSQLPGIAHVSVLVASERVLHDFF